MNLNMKMKKIMTIGLFGLVVSGMLSAPAFAKHGKHDKHERHYRDKARVIKVKPIYENVLVRHNSKHCKVDHYSLGNGRGNDRGNGGKNYSKHRSHDISPIAGAVIGSAVGNQFGSGDGRKLATIAGAVIGTVIANEVSHEVAHDSQHRVHKSKHYYASHNSHRTNKCNWRSGKKRYVKELVGYKVKYKYKGRIYKTRTRHHPGKYIDFSGGRNRH